MADVSVTQQRIYTFKQVQKVLKTRTVYRYGGKSGQRAKAKGPGSEAKLSNGSGKSTNKVGITGLAGDPRGFSITQAPLKPGTMA